MKKTMNKSKISLAIGVVLIAIGLLFGGLSLFNGWRQRQAARSFGTLPVSGQIKGGKALVQGKPNHLIIPSLNINLDVIEGYYYPASKTWTLTLDKAQYATGTPYPNNLSGDTFIYGHNRPEVFESLPLIKPGAEALVYTANKHIFIYKLVASHLYGPNDSSIFKYQGPPILTLQTCTGLWYQYRDLFSFSLVKVV